MTDVDRWAEFFDERKGFNLLYIVDGWNNFCRVFELPETYPKGFCPPGGLPATFQMVDWFSPVPGLGVPAISKKAWLEKFGSIEQIEVSHNQLQTDLIPFVRKKVYIKPLREYLVICSFGATLMFEGKAK